MRVTNPASNPELLDALAKDFVEHEFDLKHLVRTICNSTTYQLAAEPNDWNQDDKQNFSRYYPKRLNAEVLLDAIDQVTGTQTSFSGRSRRARGRCSCPTTASTRTSSPCSAGRKRRSACECERSSEANLAQSLHLLNSSEIQGKLTAASGNAATPGRRQGAAARAEDSRAVPARLFARADDRGNGDRPGPHPEERARPQAGLRRHRLGPGQHEGVFVQPLDCVIARGRRAGPTDCAFTPLSACRRLQTELSRLRRQLTFAYLPSIRSGPS